MTVRRGSALTALLFRSLMIMMIMTAMIYLTWYSVTHTSTGFKRKRPKYLASKNETRTSPLETMSILKAIYRSTLLSCGRYCWDCVVLASRVESFPLLRVPFPLVYWKRMRLFWITVSCKRKKEKEEEGICKTYQRLLSILERAIPDFSYECCANFDWISSS